MKKINWGTGIVISIIIFMIISVSMMLIFINQKVDLVTENYYEKTLVYQEQIDIKKRTAELKEDVEINYDGNNINIIFPKSILNEISSGEIYFYRPSDSNQDFIIPLRINDEGEQSLSASEIAKGFWKIGISWIMNKEDYLTEKSIIIN